MTLALNLFTSILTFEFHYSVHLFTYYHCSAIAVCIAVPLSYS